MIRSTKMNKAIFCTGHFSVFVVSSLLVSGSLFGSTIQQPEVRLVPISATLRPRSTQPQQPGQAIPVPRLNQGLETLPNNAQGDLQGNGQDQEQEKMKGVVKLLKPHSIETKERETIVRRYPSGKRQLVREVVMDNNGNFISDGKWRLFHTDSRLIGKGSFRDGLMFGPWQRVHLDKNHPWFESKDFQGFEFPLISSADFENGKLTGLWKMEDRNRKKIVEFTYDKGLRQGEWIWYYPDGKKRRVINFQKGLLHGRWVRWSNEGKVELEDWYQEGRRIYKVTSYFEQEKPETQSTFMSGKMEIAEKDDWWNARLASYRKVGQDVQHGPIRSWYDNGQTHMVGYFKNGMRDGDFAWWHPNGVRKSLGKFQEGKQIGQWRWWFDNGMKQSAGSYIEGIADGRWIKWDRKGSPIADHVFDRNKQSVAKPAFESEGPNASPISPEIELKAPGETKPSTQGEREGDEQLPPPRNGGLLKDDGSPGGAVGTGLQNPNSLQLTPAGGGRVST